MGNVAYEMLGRATWAVGKRQVRRKLAPSRNRKKTIGAIAALTVAVVVAGGVIARSAATHR